VVEILSFATFVSSVDDELRIEPEQITITMRHILILLLSKISDLIADYFSNILND